MEERTKIIDELEQNASLIMVDCSLLKMPIVDEKKTLKRVANCIDNMYDLFEKLLKSIKEQTNDNL